MNKISKIKTFIIASIACFGVAGCLAVPSYADSCPSGWSIDSNSGICHKDSTVEVWGLVSTVINVILAIVGVIAVVMIIFGGIQYTTSAGDPGKVKKAKDAILYGIVGLVIALAAFAIVNFVLNNVFEGGSTN